MMGWLSMSRWRESIWVWLFWGLGTFLVLELGTFLLAGLALSKTAGELAGPFLAFATPSAIFMSFVWWIRKREDRRAASPKQLARAWGLSMMFFWAAAISAICYSGVELRLINHSDAIGVFITSILLGVPMAYFVAYSMTLPVITSRAARHQGQSGPR